ncbi:Conjugal transfer protein TraG [Methylobacterium radiotolerans]|nr:Conjugal transfer protein TraG [Methylobacterium radiotolerans]
MSGASHDSWRLLKGMFQAGMWLHGMAKAAEHEARAAAAAAEASKPLDPMLGLAAGDDLNRYRYRPGAFHLGRIHEDHGVSFDAGLLDDRHIFMVAGNRAGKGRSLGIRNCLTWPGPIFCIDPKGEAASICAVHRGTAAAAKGTGTSVRAFHGQPVGILDPLGEVRGPARAYRTGYNPLVDVDLRRGGGVKAIRAVASAIITQESGDQVHFSETAETLLAGVIEAVKLKEKAEDQTLPFCRSLLSREFDTLHDYLSKGTETRAGLAREAAALMDQVGSDEWGSHRSTLSRNLKWLAAPEMQDHLRPVGFSLRQAVQSGWSIFVVIPPLQVADYKPWLRLTVRMALEAKADLGVNQRGPQTLFLLDEFGSALGHFQLIEDAAGNMAGYGIKLVPIIQNIGQVVKLYQKNWETFLGNAGAIVAWGLNDKDSETYIADRLGHIMVSEYSAGSSGSWSAGGGSGGSSYNIGRHQRPVRFPNQVHEEGARETMRAFVIPASGRGFTIRRVNYDKEEGLHFDHPDYISAWERRFSSKIG